VFGQLPQAGGGLGQRAKLDINRSISIIFNGESPLESVSDYQSNVEVRSWFNRLSLDTELGASHKVGEDFGKTLGYGFSFKVGVFGNPQTINRLSEIAKKLSNELTKLK